MSFGDKCSVCKKTRDDATLQEVPFDADPAEEPLDPDGDPPAGWGHTSAYVCTDGDCLAVLVHR